MAYSDRLQTNNTNIQNCINKVNALPNAGSGGDTSMEDGLVARSLTSYSNDRVTTIGSYAFYYNPVTSVSCANVMTIGVGAFQRCTNLTSVNFPKATTISNDAFMSCYALTAVNFPNVTYISSKAFYTCTRLTSVSFPNATYIGSSAFESCSTLTSVSFPNATIIDDCAFRNCSSLTYVDLPKLTEINMRAFARCINLTSLTFPNVKSIHQYAFENCTNLVSVYILGSSRCGLDRSDAFSGTGIGSNKGSIFVPASLLASYKGATNWVYFSNRIFSV